MRLTHLLVGVVDRQEGARLTTNKQKRSRRRERSKVENQPERKTAVEPK